MVELLEYALVIGVSSILAAACVLVVGGAIPELNQVAAVSKADQVAGAARISILEDRNVTLLLPMQGSSVSCSSGILQVSIDGYSHDYEIGYPCDFGLQNLQGTCSLFFSAPSDSLQLEATC